MRGCDGGGGGLTKYVRKLFCSDVKRIEGAKLKWKKFENGVMVWVNDTRSGECVVLGVNMKVRKYSTKVIKEYI